MENNTPIVEFNKALRRSVKEKWDKLKKNYSDAKIFRFDLDNAEAVEIIDLDEDKAIIMGIPEKIIPPPDNGLEYFWIEYTGKNKEGKDVPKKFAFFFKDVDTNTHNVHVVPGIIEVYELQNEPPKNRPYACEENERVIIKNVKDNGCLLFAEKNAKGDWWVPVTEESTSLSGYKRIKTKDEDPENGVETIKDYSQKDVDVFALFDDFNDFEKEHSSEIVKRLETSRKGLTLGYKRAHWSAKRYKLLGWYNINGDKEYSMYLSKPIYFSGFGFFTQYNCVWFGAERKEIIINCPVVKPKSEAVSTLGNSFENFKEIEKECTSILEKNEIIQKED